MPQETDRITPTEAECAAMRDSMGRPLAAAQESGKAGIAGTVTRRHSLCHRRERGAPAIGPDRAQ
jgi:hypothetical protein